MKIVADIFNIYQLSSYSGLHWILRLEIRIHFLTPIPCIWTRICSPIFKPTEKHETFTSNFSTLSMTTFCQFDISPRTPPRLCKLKPLVQFSINKNEKKVFDYFASCLVDWENPKAWQSNVIFSIYFCLTASLSAYTNIIDLLICWDNNRLPVVQWADPIINSKDTNPIVCFF